MPVLQPQEERLDYSSVLFGHWCFKKHLDYLVVHTASEPQCFSSIVSQGWCETSADTEFRSPLQFTHTNSHRERGEGKGGRSGTIWSTGL